MKSSSTSFILKSTWVMGHRK